MRGRSFSHGRVDGVLTRFCVIRGVPSLWNHADASPAIPAFVMALLNSLTVQADIVVGGIGVPEGEACPISVFTSVAQGALFSDGFETVAE